MKMEEKSNRDLEIIETHKEIIERDAREISRLWKIIPMFFYLNCAISGYVCSILFYIFWMDIYGGNCPIWAQLQSPIHTRTLRLRNSEIMEEEGPEIISDDWRKNLIITFDYNFQCRFFFAITLCSCSFGITWFILVSKCGKGGYDTQTYIAPWRIVPPALLFHLIFAIIVISAVHEMIYGYWSFTKNLKMAANVYMNDFEVESLKNHCDIVTHYLKVDGNQKHNICYIYAAIQILAWMMAWSWLVILGIFILRVAAVIDFRLLTTKIYRIPKKQIPVDATIDLSPIKKQRIKKIVFVTPESPRN